MRKCSYCGKENDDSSIACAGCGTPLAAESTAASRSIAPRVSLSKEVAQKKMIYGGIWFLGGLFVTIGSFAVSGAGNGGYFVAWGAIAFGAVKFFQGLSGLEGASQGVPDAYDELAAATALETKGFTPEAMRAYRSIADRHPNSPVGLDAQKSLEALRQKLG